MSWHIEIELRDRGATALLRFSDVQRGNQLCWAAMDQMALELRAQRKAGARTVVLASGLPGHWLGHAWLADLIAGREGREQTGSGMGWFGVLEELCHPDWVSIAAINGNTAGGGAELGWACDLRVAERQAHFCQPEVGMGLTTGIGGTARLARLVGRSTAAQMVLTGLPETAERLHTLGAINFLVDSGEAEAHALSLAATLCTRASGALAGLKQILNQAEQMPLDEALRAEQAVFQSVLARDDALLAMHAAQARYDADG